MKPKSKLQLLLLSLTFTTLFFQCKDEADPITGSSPIGTTVDTLLHSSGLEDNLLGDTPDRRVLIYLPPGYEDDQSSRYPVIYFLHGFTQHANYSYSDFFGSLNTLIRMKEIVPMIVVFPDSNNKYKGSWYTNSPVTGQWEDFIVRDVVTFVDTNYRTIRSVNSRGIAGHSMGGYGAIKLAMKFPGEFCAAYALSPALTVFSETVLGTTKEQLIQAVQSGLDEYNSLPLYAKSHIACAAAFAPNPNSLPYYGDFPVTVSGTLIDSTWQKWLAHDPSSMLISYKDSLLLLRSIKIDCGTRDAELFDSNVHFSDELAKYEIESSFEEYDGNHVDRLGQRISESLLPFFSEILDHE